MFRVTYVLILLLALVLAGPVAASDTSGATDPPDTLYLLPPAENGAKNFTTYPPTAARPVLDDPDQVSTGRFLWSWRISGSPQPWTLTPQAEHLATVHLEGLERVVPVPDTRPAAESIGKIRVTVELFIGGGTTSDTGIDAPLFPQYANATGSILLDAPMLTGARGPFEVTVPVRAIDTFEVEPHFEFAVRVSVTGTTPAEERPNLLVGSAATPSRIVTQGYPLAAFRAWEEADRQEEECLKKVLEGRSCTPDPDDDVPPVAEEAAGPPVVGLLVVLVLVGGASSRWRGRRSRRDSRRPTSPCPDRTASR